ncbi:MAG: tyrosine-type recombinase/integrase, partial [Planctomycetia bacterium]
MAWIGEPDPYRATRTVVDEADDGKRLERAVVHGLRSLADDRPTTAGEILDALGADQAMTAAGRQRDDAKPSAHGGAEFTRWMVKVGRANRDPLATLSKRNEATDRRHVRRVLTTEELATLSAAAETGPTVGAADGPTRATVYALAAMAGLRHGEIAKLKRTDFDLESRTLGVRATVAKNRTETYLPIHPGLAGRLAAWFDAHAIEPTDPSPFGWVGKVNTAGLLRVDLAAAGIDYATDSGVVDFHALRVTFITSLHRAGVPLATAQKLARHSDPKLTSNVYGKMDLFD